MSADSFDVVTGAFGYSGGYIARRLIGQGRQVRTLTGKQPRGPLAGRVEAMPFQFDDPDALARSLEGARALFNTYWVRFEHGGMTFEQAVANTKTLFAAAKQAGVGRVVHVSITNPSEDSRLPYFHGKAVLERALRESGLSYAILRPAVLFGATPGEDVLINNIAWLLRRLPLFGVMGDGSYRLQPVHVDDLARLAVEQAEHSQNVTLDAVGPEIFTFADLVRRVRDAVGSRAGIVRTPPALALAAARTLSLFLGDVLLTRDEVTGLMDDLLISADPPTGLSPLSEWLAEHANGLGRRYSSELKRHFR